MVTRLGRGTHLRDRLDHAPMQGAVALGAQIFDDTPTNTHIVWYRVIKFWTVTAPGEQKVCAMSTTLPLQGLIPVAPYCLHFTICSHTVWPRETKLSISKHLESGTFLWEWPHPQILEVCPFLHP